MGRKERCDAEGELASRVAKLFTFVAAKVCVEFCKRFSSRVLDPFCGHGTVLHVAEELGMDNVGVDIDLKVCKVAKKFLRWTVEADTTISGLVKVSALTKPTLRRNSQCQWQRRWRDRGTSRPRREPDKCSRSGSGLARC